MYLFWDKEFTARELEELNPQHAGFIHLHGMCIEIFGIDYICESEFFYFDVKEQMFKHIATLFAILSFTEQNKILDMCKEYEKLRLYHMDTDFLGQ